MFYVLFSCGEPIGVVDGTTVAYTDRKEAEEALAWYVADGDRQGFDDSATEIRELVLAQAVQK